MRVIGGPSRSLIGVTDPLERYETCLTDFAERNGEDGAGVRPTARPRDALSGRPATPMQMDCDADAPHHPLFGTHTLW